MTLIVIDALGIGTRRIENKNTSGNYPKVTTVNIGQNTEKSPGELKDLL